MNLSNQGNGQVYGTKPQQGETCYSLNIQVLTPPGADYCTDAPDYSCYSNGRPSCCNQPGRSNNCPANKPACDVPTPPPPGPPGPLGAIYCTYAPDYSCYSSGRPSCCNQPGGSNNCPASEPPCDLPTPPGPPGKTQTGFESYRQDMTPSMKGSASGVRSVPKNGFQNYRQDMTTSFESYRQDMTSSLKGAAPEVKPFTYVAKKRGGSKFYGYGPPPEQPKKTATAPKKKFYLRND